MKLLPLLFLFVSLLSLPAAELKTVEDFKAAADKANAVLTIPEWPQTPDEVEAGIKTAIDAANAALDQIGSQEPAKVTFKSTVVALDDVAYQANLAGNRTVVVKETNTSKEMREAAEKAVKTFQDWAVGVDYREDVYRAIKAFEKTNPKLTGEDKKLLQETLRDYRRAGLEFIEREARGSRTVAQRTRKSRDRL